MPDNSGRGQLAWTNDAGWQIRQRYLRDTLTTSVSLEHHGLQLVMYCNDTVDFHRNIHVRKIKLKNLAYHERVVKIYHHQDFNMYGTKIGDTAYFDPELRSVVHYRNKRYLMVTFFGQGEQRLDEYACGTSGFGGAEGTWRDAEDGHLQGNAIAQGAVDSTAGTHVELAGDGERSVYMVIVAAQSRDELLEMHKWITKTTPQGVIDRTSSYWRLWLAGTNINFGNLPPKVVDLFKRSLLVVRTQIDNGGAIIAANDTDIMQFARDTYSYVWPRDGALVADSLDLAGFPDIARWFYSFCSKVTPPRRLLLSQVQPRRFAGQQLAPVGDPQQAGDADPGGRDGARRLGHVAALLPLPGHRVRPPAVGRRGPEGGRLHVPLPRPPHGVARCPATTCGRSGGASTPSPWPPSTAGSRPPATSPSASATGRRRTSTTWPRRR